MSSEAMERAKHAVYAMLNQLRALLRDSPNRKLSEADTKAIFVEPLLAGLGFVGLQDITREYYIKDSREFVDYMLYVAGNPIMIVEAKQLQHELDARDGAQLVQYAAIEGLEWCSLVNGRRLQLFNAYLKAPLAGKLVADFDLLAFNTDAEFDALFDDLWLLSKESFATPAGLKAWMNQRRVDSAMRSILTSTDSLVISAVQQALHQADIDIDTEAIVQWFRSRLLAPVNSLPPGGENPHTKPKTPEVRGSNGANCWLFPVSARKHGHRDGTDMPADEVLRRWLNRSMWGVWKDTAGRKHVKSGEQACFYLSGTGVVAIAQIAGLADQIVTPSEWPEDKPAERDVYKIPLTDVQWFERPVVFTGDLRAKLEAFAGRSLDASWSWFVQSTKQLSPADFRTIRDRGALTSSPFKMAEGGGSTDAERHAIRRKFWESLLVRARERGVLTHARRSPSTDSWLSAGSGLGGVEYVYQFLIGEGRIGVELYISTHDRERNKRIFDDLFARRAQIEADFGAALEWRRMDNNRASSIRRLDSRVGLRDERNWSEVRETLINAMDRLSKTFGPHIERIRRDTALRK